MHYTADGFIPHTQHILAEFQVAGMKEQESFGRLHTHQNPPTLPLQVADADDLAHMGVLYFCPLVLDHLHPDIIANLL